MTVGMESTLRRCLVFFALVALCGASLAMAQGAAATSDRETPETLERGVEEDLRQIEEMIQEEESVLAGAGYTYDPGNRRDPFRSLLVTVERADLSGPRPEGVPGLLIDEVELTGIFVMGDGPVAQVQSPDTGKSELIRVGDRLYDGDVVSIGKGEVVFKQIVDDPTALKPFREVVKKLNP